LGFGKNPEIKVFFLIVDERRGGQDGTCGDRFFFFYATAPQFGVAVSVTHKTEKVFM